MTVAATGRYAAEGFVVRVAGLPTSAVESLRFERTWAHMRQVLVLRRWLDAEGTALSEDLYGLIGEVSQPGLKPVLVALRRAVFTGRRPGPRTWSPAVARVLPSEVADRVRVWLERLEQRGDLETALPDVLKTELAVKREVLRAAVATDIFQYGLVQGSPVLAEQLGKWLEGAQETVPGRQVLVRLSKYLSRVVAKTSPYSTFTLLGAGRWSADGPALVPADAGVWRSVVDLNGWVTQHLGRLLAAQPESVNRLVVRINPSIRWNGAKLWLLGHGPGEPLCRVTASAAVQECLKLVQTTPGVTVGAVREHLGGQGDQARTFVGRLVALGLLEPVMPVADQAVDPLRRLSTWLATVDHADGDADGAHLGRTRTLCRALRELDGCMRTYPRLASPKERAAQHDLIRARLTDLFAWAPEPNSGLVWPSGAPVLPGKNLIDENAVLTGQAQECGLRHWRPALADLEPVRVLSGLFTRDLPIRLAAAEFFTATFGNAHEVSFLDFYRTVRTMEGRDPTRWPPPAVGRAADLAAVGIGATAGRVSSGDGRAGEPTSPGNSPAATCASHRRSWLHHGGPRRGGAGGARVADLGACPRLDRLPCPGAARQRGRGPVDPQWGGDWIWFVAWPPELPAGAGPAGRSSPRDGHRRRQGQRSSFRRQRVGR